MCSLIPPVRASLVPEISYNKHIYRRVALATADSRKSGQLEDMGGIEEIRFLGGSLAWNFKAWDGWERAPPGSAKRNPGDRWKAFLFFSMPFKSSV